jgi:MFS family permease
MKKKIDYSWVIIALCFLTVCISLGFCSSGRTMYLTAITDALNIKRSAFSLGDTLRYITTTILNLFFGTLIVKFGEKKLICAGFVCLISFTLINSFAEHLIFFYLSSILLGTGLSWCTTSMMSYVVSKWCNEKNRGTVMGAVLAANGLGGAMSAQILSPIIFEEGNPFGYRNAYRLVAVILAIMLLLIILFFKDKKSEDESAPVRKTRKARGGGWVGMEFSEAKKKPYFYVAIISVMFIGMSLQGLGGIATPHMYDVGLSKPLVANISTVSSILLMSSKFLAGFVYDKTGIKITMNAAFIASFFSLLCLVLVSNTTLGIVIAFVRVVFSVIALPLETIMLPLFASELFGNKCFAKTVGVFTAACTAGFAIGAPFGNLCYDIFGNYNVAFIVFACLMLFVTVAMQFVVRAAHKDRKIIEEREASYEEVSA